MSRPRVSIILPTFNGLSRGYLGEAIESVIQQTYEGWDLVIVDDGSMDNIAAGCAHYMKDPRVRIIRRENGGLSAARKTGVENARGEFLAFLDDDDRWAPKKLEDQLAFFEHCPDPKAGMVFTGIRLIDSTGCLIGARRKKASSDIYRKLVLHGNGITAPSAVMVKRSVIDAVGSFDPAMKSLEDLDLWLRISRRYHIYSMPELLTDYRLHGNTITAVSFSREEQYEGILYDRILREDPSFDRKAVLANMHFRFAVRQISLGRYDLARERLRGSLRIRFSITAFFFFFICLMPSRLLDGMKALRRRSTI